MNFVFIVERYNDLDMISPIVWKCSTYKNSNVVIVNAWPKYLSSTDYRIAFLKKNPSVKYIEIHQTLNDISNYIFSRLRLGWFYKQYLNSLFGPSQKYFERIPIDRSMPTIVMVSYITHAVVKSAMIWAEKNKFIKAFHDHGIHPFVYPSREKNSINPDLPIHPDIPINSFNFYILNNKETFKNNFSFNDKLVTKIYSSARFSKEWSNKLSEICPKIELNLEKNKFKIVFMLSKWKNKDDKKLILSAVKAASQIKDTEVIVKPHTRGMKFDFLMPSNVLVVDENVHSRQLIEESSVVVFTRSSIFLDAVLLDKPVIHLSYTTSVELASKSLNECKVYSQKDFISKLLMIKMKGRNYSSTDRKICLDFYAGSNYDGNMLDDIVNKLKKENSN
jgi:hypothetical protein